MFVISYNGKKQVETLLDKYSEYMKDESDNSTRIIREALRTHTDVVQLLLAHGADPLLQDNEGHVAADFDYKPPEVLTMKVGGQNMINMSTCITIICGGGQCQ